MGLEHLQIAPETQPEGTNYCWAAGLSWWLKAVRKYNYSFAQIKDFYEDWTIFEDNGNYGCLDEKGMYKLLNDPRWHLWYEKVSTDKFTDEKFDTLLAQKGPFIIGYTDSNLGTDEKGNKLNGFHMNIIVAKAGSGSGQYHVMDPNHSSFKVRNSQYYRDFYCSKALLAYSTSLGNSPVYGYQ